ncbi:MAG: hypothetical protein HYU85_07880 [Chloroflexi bacterium]|nr:hypothetical protein [Chloroflexota bacterium]MBI3930399.1 hypothetical protein [Chloroflexota bacterium]
MEKLKIGHLHIKPLYFALLTVGLLFIIGGTIALLNNPASWYEYGYSFEETDLKGLGHIDFSTVLAKGEAVRGKLVVESGMVVLVITAKNELQKSRRVVDSGEIQAGRSFSFSVMSDWTYTSYDASFSLTGDANARFYSNLAPIISGTRWETESGKLITRPYPFNPFREGREIKVIFRPSKLR